MRRSRSASCSAVSGVCVCATAFDFYIALFSAFGIERDVDGILSDLVNLTTGGIGPLVPYLLLVLMLIFRPRGLFGMRDV